MTRIEAVKSFDEFLKLEPYWNNLLAQSDADMPFMTFEWFRLWLRLFGKGKEILILLVKDNSDVITAIAPFIVEKIKLRGIPVKAIKFMENYYSVRAGMIVTGNQIVFPELLKYLNEMHTDWDMMWLDQIVKDSVTNRQIKDALKEGRLKSKEMPGNKSPYIKIDCDWDKYVQERPKRITFKDQKN